VGVYGLMIKMLEENKIHCGNCMELMKHIPDKIVDMILCDLPYGITACEWDKVLPLDELWKQYKRILKEDGVVVLTASQPFTTDLINSNRKWFRYEWIWFKNVGSAFFNYNNRPIKYHENILVFFKKQPIFNPQMEKRTSKFKDRYKYKLSRPKYSEIYGSPAENREDLYEKDLIYPKSVQKINAEPNHNGRSHPTQKPVKLFRYLIETYTQEGELVLDNCIGSGTTAVACKQANRRFIGIELSQEYVDIANKRLQQDNLHAFFQTQGVLTEPSPNRI